MSIEIDWKLVERLSLKTNHMAQRAQQAEAVGQTGAARANWDRARRLAIRAAEIMRHTEIEALRSNMFYTAAVLSFNCGRFDECKGFIESGLSGLNRGTNLPSTIVSRQTSKLHQLLRLVRHEESLNPGRYGRPCPSTGTEAGPTQEDRSPSVPSASSADDDRGAAQCA